MFNLQKRCYKNLKTFFWLGSMVWSMFALSAKTVFYGGCDLSDLVQDSVTCNGATSISSCKINTVVVRGSATIWDLGCDQITVQGSCNCRHMKCKGVAKFQGAASLKNCTAERLNVKGSSNLVDSSFGSVDLAGPSTMTNVKIAENLLISCGGCSDYNGWLGSWINSVFGWMCSRSKVKLGLFGTTIIDGDIVVDGGRADESGRPLLCIELHDDVVVKGKIKGVAELKVFGKAKVQIE